MNKRKVKIAKGWKGIKNSQIAIKTFHIKGKLLGKDRIMIILLNENVTIENMDIDIK